MFILFAGQDELGRGTQTQVDQMIQELFNNKNRDGTETIYAEHTAKLNEAGANIVELYEELVSKLERAVYINWYIVPALDNGNKMTEGAIIFVKEHTAIASITDLKVKYQPE